MLPRILVLEDDSLVARSLARYFSANAQVTIAGTLAAAMAVRDSAWAGLLIDVDLPDGCGLDLLAYDRSMGRSTPALVLTGRFEREIVERVSELGASYACKPASSEALEQLVVAARAATASVEDMARVAATFLTEREIEIVLCHARGMRKEAYLAREGMTLEAYDAQVRAMLMRTGHASIDQIVQSLMARAYEAKN
jgi:DNA-binding response OmpR family regulator